MADDLSALERISTLVSGFEMTATEERFSDADRTVFIDPAKGDRARAAGQSFWLPVKRTYSIFVCAYSAMFAIPSFTDEALARQPDRFSGMAARATPLRVGRPCNSVYKSVQSPCQRAGHGRPAGKCQLRHAAPAKPITKSAETGNAFPKAG